MPIAEFPGIRIDDFTQRAGERLPELCFLTHMHEDHTHGLARKSYYGPHLYCTATTRALLLNFRSNSGSGELKYNHLRREVCGKEIVKILDLDRPYELPYYSTSVQVTLIDANHCPGAAMVLVQPKLAGTSVLFTGDLRCEKWHVDALLHNPAIHPFLRSKSRSRGIRNNGKSCKPAAKKHADSIALYVDSTYESHANPYKPYPANYEGIQELLTLMSTYPKAVHFCLADRVTGYEEVLISAAQHLNTRVHMDSYLYNLYMLAADTSPLAQRMLSVSTIELADDVRLHFCQKNTGCSFRDPESPTAYFKPCNQPPRKLVERQNEQHLARNVPPGVLVPLSEDGRVFRGPDQRYFFDGEKYFPLFPWFYFSRHASYTEVRDLCSLFNACSVKSLEGKPLTLPLLSAEQSSTLSSNGSLAQRVTSISSGQVPDGMALPLLRRRKIPVFGDRERRKRHHERTTSSSSFSSSIEERDHQAMMQLGQFAEERRVEKEVEREAKRQMYHRSFVDAEQQLLLSLGRDTSQDVNDVTPMCQKVVAQESAEHSGEQGRDSTGTEDGLRACQETAIEREIGMMGPVDDSSLPSPPCAEETFKFVDETPTEQAQLDMLVEQLRSEPSAWFDLKLDCLPRKCVS